VPRSTFQQAADRLLRRRYRLKAYAD
jgi:hypothetical protein